mgnify:CR=1 FL=1
MPEVLWTICAILGVLVLAYLFTRYVARTGTGRRSKPPGKADAYNFGPGGGGKGSKAPPGPRGRNVLFPGGDSGGASPVWKRLTAEEAEAWMGGADGAAAPKMGFQEALHSVLEQRKQQRRP